MAWIFVFELTKLSWFENLVTAFLQHFFNINIEDEITGLLSNKHCRIVQIYLSYGHLEI